MAFSITEITNGNLQRLPDGSGGYARDSSGRLYFPVNTGGTLSIYYSDNEGATWATCTLSGTTHTLLSNDEYGPSIFITNNDDIVMGYTNNSVRAIVCKGTISGTTITFQAGLDLHADTAYLTGNVKGYHDGTSTTYIIMTTFLAGTARGYLTTSSVTTGAPTSNGNFLIENDGASWCVADVDFEHTGDGVTPAVTYPDLYVVSQRQTGNVTYRLFTNDGDHTWTAGTSAILPDSCVAPSTPSDAHQVRYDGEGYLWVLTDITISPYVGVTKIDVTTGGRNQMHPAATASTTDPTGLQYDTLTGDIIIANVINGNQQFQVNRWSRTAGAWDGWTNSYDPTASRPAYSVGLAPFTWGVTSSIKLWSSEYVTASSEYMMHVDIDEITLGTEARNAPIYKTSSTTNVLSTSLTIPKPSGTVDGDLLLALVVAANTADWTVTPSGWTEIVSVGENTQRVSAFYKIADSEGASYTWTSAGTNAKAGGILRFENATGVDGGAAQAVGLNTTNAVTVPADTTTLDPAVRVIYGGHYSGGGNVSFTPPTYYTEVFDTYGTNRHSITVAYLEQPAGSLASVDFTRSDTSSAYEFGLTVSVVNEVASAGGTGWGIAL